MSKELNYQNISQTLSSSYKNYCDSLENTLNEYCEKDKNIATIVELLFNDYREGTKNFYMSRCMKKILLEIYHYDVIFSFHYSINKTVHLVNPIENILSFIVKYLRTDIEISETNIDFSEFKLNQGLYYGVKLELDDNGYMHVDTQEFIYEMDMNNNGYTNNINDYIEFLEKYSEYKLNNNKEK